MSRFMRKPAMYRGTDGVMRTLSQTAEHMCITVEELRLRWFGVAPHSHIANDADYYKMVRRNHPGRERGY